MLQSRGVLVKHTSVTWTGTPATWGTWPRSLELGDKWVAYGQLYREQLWVTVVVSKLAKGIARLPLKVYERDDLNRPEARNHPYALLLRQPNPLHSPFFFWLWMSSTFDVYGEAFLGKMRDRGGRPTSLVPLHPTGMRVEDERADGTAMWSFDNGNVRIDNIPDHDLVVMRAYNPDSFKRGMSPLEPLRRTLENEDAARRATSSFWQRGARPGVALKHPKNISDPALRRLRAQWDDIASGADNTGATVLLEEGMEPQVLSLTAEEAQYIETRKLNREEVCAAYDVPPPVVHILDHATFANITEQMRSMYRDTMAPRLKWFESELETQLRASLNPRNGEPDFGDEVYAEFLLDEVLRGDFEQRMDAYQKAINSGQLTPAEAREMENRPYIEGSDQLLVNSTMIPLTVATEPPAEPAPAPALEPPLALTQADLRGVMGVLSRPKSLEDVDRAALAANLNGHGPHVLSELDAATARGESVAAFRDHLKSFAVPDPVDPQLEVAKALAAIAAKETPAPVVNVHPPNITVEAPPPANVTVEAPPPQSITVESPQVTVHVPKQGGTKAVERDSDGNIVRIVEE